MAGFSSKKKIPKNKTPRFIDIIRDKSLKNTIKLYIVDHEQVQIIAPVKLSQEKILKILEEKERWHFKEKPIFIDKFKSQIEEGSLFWYLGHQYKIHFQKKGTKPQIVHHEIHLPAKGLSKEKIKALLQKWYKKEARQYFIKRVPQIAQEFGFTFSSLRMSSAKTRWASCSYKDSLAFSWRLIQAPPWVIDYVILHELVHTKIKNHSSEFWKELSKFYPNYKEANHWLKAHALELLSW